MTSTCRRLSDRRLCKPSATAGRIAPPCPAAGSVRPAAEGRAGGPRKRPRGGAGRPSVRRVSGHGVRWLPGCSSATRVRRHSHRPGRWPPGARIIAGGHRRARPGSTAATSSSPPSSATCGRRWRSHRKKIFGPVVCLIPTGMTTTRSPSLNDSRYGLAGAVWSADRDRAMGGSPANANGGALVVNGGAFNPIAPLRRIPQSGHWPRARPLRPRRIPGSQDPAMLRTGGQADHGGYQSAGETSVHR